MTTGLRSARSEASKRILMGRKLQKLWRQYSQRTGLAPQATAREVVNGGR
ncbi:MAG: hypothetical protein INH43_12060 [Acidobacteriaceae bacterium]|jgi:hypothetical protein|nr:hypothetical protein [Acidobacteriaceae bacterium]